MSVILCFHIVIRKDIVWKRTISYCSNLLLNIFLVPGLPNVHTKIKIAAVSGEFLLFEQIFLRFPAFLKDPWCKVRVKKWRGDLFNVIRKDRVVDDSLQRQIDADMLHICERHVSDYQFYFYATRKSLKKGAIPTLNLPQKDIPSITSPLHSTITITKREESIATQVLSSSALFYKDFLQFKKRIVKLQIKSSRQLCNINILIRYPICTKI